MNTPISDYAAQTPARGASVRPAEKGGASEASPDQLRADEAALTKILRLLNQVKPPGALSPVERAFVLGAKAIFAELTQVCDNLLAPGSEAALGAVAGLPAANAPAEPARPAQEAAPEAKARVGRRTTPGGGSQ